MEVFNSVVKLAEASLPVGQIVKTKGYYTPGDGMGYEYLISAPQTVGEYRDFTLANGNTAILQDNGAKPHFGMWGMQTSQSLSGADSSPDNALRIAALITWVDSVFYYGEVELDSGYYRTTASVDCPNAIVFRGTGPNESYIHADHLAGPGIRFRDSDSGIKTMGVTSSTTRKAGAYGAGNNFGVLFEGDDVPELDPGAPRLLHCMMEDFYLAGHPEGAAHIVGPAFTGVIKNPNVNGTKGHGISFDRGEATGRVNLISVVISGITPIQYGRISNCGGHAVAVGSPTSAFSTPGLRVVIDNVEGANNATDAAVRYFNSPVYLRGANHVFENSGLDTNAGGASAVVAGRNIHLRNNRMLGSYSNAYIITTYDELPTDGIYIDGMSVIGPLASLDPAVLVNLSAGETVAPKNIFINQGETANITEIIGTDSTLGNSDFRRIAGVVVNGDRPPAYKVADQVVNNSAAAAADDDLHVWLAPNEEVLFDILVEYDSTTTADIRATVTGPVGSAIRYTSGESSLKVGTTDTATIQSVSTGTLTFGAGGIGTSRVAHITGHCLNGGSEGYLQFNWAQLSAEASDTTVFAGISNMTVKRVVS